MATGLATLFAAGEARGGDGGRGRESVVSACCGLARVRDGLFWGELRREGEGEGGEGRREGGKGGG